MDSRQALAPGTRLRLSTSTGCELYSVSREIGRGGFCIVYDASYTDNLGNRKLVIIKECYPHAMRIKREAAGCLTAAERDIPAFHAARKRMVAAYQRNHELFMADGLTNAVANTSDLYEANGTVYIVSSYLNGRTFADYHGDTLYNCISLVLSAAKVIGRIHNAGCLYLDLKPENILTVDGSHDLVQLFDFDSTISMDELYEAVQSGDFGSLRTSCTKGYAPPEQQTNSLKQLGRHTDLYSLGAVLFYALWHRTPTAFDCEPDAEYDYESFAYPYENYQDKLFKALSEFFRKTLASYYGDRYQSADEAVSQLREILALADETKPWLRSAYMQKPVVFYGRENELTELHRLICENTQHIISLYGMGGIGKSTLVRQYLFSHADEWGACLWLYDRNGVMEAFADDDQLYINTHSRMKEESADEYLKRKLKVLGMLAKSQRIIMVIDNFVAAHIDELNSIAQMGITLLLISRERLPEGLYPSMHLTEMEDSDLSRLFAHYSHCDINDEDNIDFFRSIIITIGSHTLLTELIARQVAQGYQNLQTVAEMLFDIGFNELSCDKLDYLRDQKAFRGSLPKILDRLVEANKFTEQDRLCLKLLSLFDPPGIDAELFWQIAALPSLDFANELEASGWLKAKQKQLYLHPVMQDYIRAWPWNETSMRAAERIMQNLYSLIRPSEKGHDGSKQFPANYSSLYRLLTTADQLINHTEWVSESSQRLLFRLLMDAPVDQDLYTLHRMLELLKNPLYLDCNSVLRLYEDAAYLRARLYAPEDAVKILGEMKRYLILHPSAYYMSAYHRAMAVILHNADEYGNLTKCLRHEDKAIRVVRLSSHPDAKKQLASCLLDKATTLLSADIDREQARRLVQEAKPLVDRYASAADYERYQYACIAAMLNAMEGDLTEAELLLKAADDIALASPDSDLSVAEHLIEQVAPIRMAMEQYDKAADAVIQAISLCNRHENTLRYREARFDAYLFLGRIYALDGKYAKSKAAFTEAERYIADSPYKWKLPLCPEDVREKAGLTASDSE